MITSYRVRAACAVAVLALAVGLGGCAGADTKAACTKVKAEIADVNSQGMSKISDPSGLKAAYADGAAKIRAAAKGTTIEDESEKIAKALETLGNQVAAFAANPSTTTPTLDSASLTQAGVDLQKACS